ncbi:hypothetical protein P8452_30045 [Trifolium repens]|nr:hypothetical protein P8452_30045 [Trifolium repens]
MHRVSNSSPKDHGSSSIVSFLYILFAALFRSFFFPFQRISFLFAKFILPREQQQQHNTHHSDPKFDDKNDDFAKFKDSEEDNTDSNPKATSLTEQEKIFELWCYCYDKTYSNQAEKKMRFGIFQKTLSSAKPKEDGHNGCAIADADRTQDEVDAMYRHYRYGYRSKYICPSDIDRLATYPGRYRYSRYTFSESDDDECWDEVYWDEECSDLESDQDDDGTL